MSVLAAILSIANLVLGPAKAALNSLLGAELWLGLDIGSVGRELETGNQVRKLGLTLQMVNERPSRPIRIEGVAIEIPALGCKYDVHAFEGRLGNKHWSQSWPLHLENDKAILRTGIDLPDSTHLPDSLKVKAIVLAPKGLRRKKILSKRLNVPDA